MGGDGLGLEGGLRTVLGLSCAKMSANVANATLVSVPKTANGVSGAGLRNRWRRSCADSLIKSTDDVAGMVTWKGKNSTVSLCLVPFVLGM